MDQMDQMDLEAESQTGRTSDIRLQTFPISTELQGETEAEAKAKAETETETETESKAETETETETEAGWRKDEDNGGIVGKHHQNTYDDPTEPRGPGCGSRHVLSFWAFLGFVNLFILRVDMTIALVAMVTQRNSSYPPLNESSSGCGVNESWSFPTPSHKEEFDWSNTLQGLVLSAFYYGYFATQVPGSFVVNRFGGKRLFAVAMAGCSVLALLTPISARLHPGVLIANRVCQGCLQGLVFPSMQTLFAKWAPPKERSRLVAFAYAGCQAGTVVGTISAGYISNSAAGWPLLFYIEGSLGLLWCIAWLWVVYDSPSLHPRISDPEKAYILRHVGHSSYQKPPRPPWRHIARSGAVYAITAGHVANDWGCFALMTCMPKFMKEVLGYDLSQNGFLSSLPYMVMWVSNLVAGALADCLRKPNRCRTVHVRKLMDTIGLMGPAVLLLVAAHIQGCGRAPMVALLTAALGLSGFTIAGHSVNHLDIAPAYAGLLFAITNSIGTTTGWIGPALATQLTEHYALREGWQTFFLVSGCLYAVGGSIYLVFARGDVQPWAAVQGTEREFIIPARVPYRSTQAQDDHVIQDTD